MAKASRAMFSLLHTQMHEAGLSTISENAIICPLCWKETEFEDLTIEHIVPTAIGGSETTLTCKSCNNTSGSKLDSQLAEFHRFENASSGIGTMRSTLKTADERLAGSLELLEGNIKFVVSYKASDPKHVASSLAKAESGIIEQMNVTAAVCDLQKLKVAFIKIAYLAAFKTIGYAFVNTDHLQTYRRAIENPAASKIPIDSLIMRFTTFNPNFEFDFCVAGCYAAGVNCGIVVVRSKLLTTKYWGVFLPHPKRDFFSEIESASMAINNGGNFRFQEGG